MQFSLRNYCTYTKKILFAAEEISKTNHRELCYKIIYPAAKIIFHEDEKLKPEIESLPQLINYVKSSYKNKNSIILNIQLLSSNLITRNNICFIIRTTLTSLLLAKIFPSHNARKSFIFNSPKKIFHSITLNPDLLTKYTWAIQAKLFNTNTYQTPSTYKLMRDPILNTITNLYFDIEIKTHATTPYFIKDRTPLLSSLVFYKLTSTFYPHTNNSLIYYSESLTFLPKESCPKAVLSQIPLHNINVANRLLIKLCYLPSSNIYFLNTMINFNPRPTFLANIPHVIIILKNMGFCDANIAPQPQFK